MKKNLFIAGLFAFCITLSGRCEVKDELRPLPPVTFSDKRSVLKGMVHDPQLKGDTVSLFYATVTGLRDESCVVDPSGHFCFDLSIGYPTEVRMGFSSYRGERVSVFLIPGEETEVKIENRSSKRYYQYTGSLARVNNEFANRAIHASLFPDVLKIDEVPSVKDVETFRDYLYERYTQLVEGIEAREDLSPLTKRLLAMQKEVQLYSFLKDAPYHLARAGIFPKSIVISTQLPDRFFVPLSGLPSLGDPRFLYCLEYAYLANQIRATLPLFTDDFLQEGLLREGWISDADFALLSRLTDLSQATSVDEFTEVEKKRLYECLKQKELYKKQCEDHYWSTIFGKDLGFIYSYWEVQREVEKIRTFVSLSAEEKERTRSWSNDFFRHEVLAFDRAMAVKKNRGLLDNEVRTNEKTGKIVDEDLFFSFYKKYKGSPVLLVFWETWLASEGTVMKTLQPLKEQLEQRGMKVVSVASEYSPGAEWKKKINEELTGRHVRVSRDQMRYLRNEYFIGNLPVFFLIDKEGVVLRRFTEVSLVRELLR